MNGKGRCDDMPKSSGATGTCSDLVCLMGRWLFASLKGPISMDTSLDSRTLSNLTVAPESTQKDGERTTDPFASGSCVHALTTKYTAHFKHACLPGDFPTRIETRSPVFLQQAFPPSHAGLSVFQTSAPSLHPFPSKSPPDHRS